MSLRSARIYYLLVACALAPAAPAAPAVVELNTAVARAEPTEGAEAAPGLWLAGTAFEVPVRARMVRRVAQPLAEGDGFETVSASALAMRWLDRAGLGPGPAAYRLREGVEEGSVRMDLWASLAEGASVAGPLVPVVNLRLVADPVPRVPVPGGFRVAPALWRLDLFPEPAGGRLALEDGLLVPEPVPLPGAAGLLVAGLLALVRTAGRGPERRRRLGSRGCACR